MMMVRMGEDSSGRWHTEFVSKNGAQQVCFFLGILVLRNLRDLWCLMESREKSIISSASSCREFQCPNPSLQLVKADLCKPGMQVQRSCGWSLVTTMLPGKHFSPNFQELNRRRRRRGADFVTLIQLIIWCKRPMLVRYVRSVTQKFGWSPFLISLTLAMLCNPSHAGGRSTTSTSVHNGLLISFSAQLYRCWSSLDN